MKETIYLVGQISVDDERSYKWRKNVRRVFGANENWEIIDPCNNGFNRAVLENAGGDTKRLRVYKTAGIDLLVPKDYSYVDRSTMAFANMNHYDPRKPIIGSAFELAWYWQMQKTVIGIFEGDHTQDVHCNHPFIKSAITTWVQDEWEACELAVHYFQDVYNEKPSFEEARLLHERLEACKLGAIS
jgi:hypothetical protein